MKLRGWVIVYSHADQSKREGYWFTASPPSSISDGSKVYTFDVEVPDPVPAVAATLVTE